MKKKHVVILAIILLIVAGGYFGIRAVFSRIDSNLELLKDVEIAQMDLTTVRDGEYFGSYSAFPISVEVNITVKNRVITSIELLKHSNGQGASAEAIIEKVVTAQSLQVDAISGATYSSKVILKAIENALHDK